MPPGCKLNRIYYAGYCVGRGFFADRTLGLKKVRFHTRSFLLEHAAKGLILIDTGYGNALLETTQKGIYSLYRVLLPVTYSSKDSVAAQLAQDGISVKDLSYVILTHFHPDHIGALPEFANVPWIYRSDALNQLMRFSRCKGLLNGFIRPLVPPTPKGSIPITKNLFIETWNNFASFDLFGDGSLHLIDLPGHALGQMGIAIKTAFFTADATWGKNALPHRLGLFVQENSKIYRKTFASLQNPLPSITIYPTHISEAHA